MMLLKLLLKLPAGKDGNSYTMYKNPDGTETITTPDGNTKTVKTGRYWYFTKRWDLHSASDGSLSITNPDGTTTVVNPGSGTNGSTTNSNGGSDAN